MNRYIKQCITFSLVFFCLPLFSSSLQYAVIIDAGSSGSRAHVFEYARSLPLIPLPLIKDIFNQSTQPGLSSYASNPSAAGPSLQPILDASVDTLRRKGANLSQVPISVLGTAGMRLLPENQQAAIYANVRQYIRDHYSFSLKNEDVRTITGIMEGVYDWLDVNYLLNNFIHPNATVGSIDMGGASTQIAFTTTDTSQSANEIVLYLNHTPYRLFSQSFLGLGQDQARQTMTTGTSYAPDAPSCYPSGYPFNSQTGNFDFSICSNTYATIIQSYNVSERVLSTEGQSFIAFSGIYYNYNFFNVLQTPTQSALESQINAVCYLSWTQLQLNYPQEPLSLLPNYCANAVYFDDLLYNTYQLQGSQLTVTNQLNGTGIDWTLGALLYQLTQ